MNNWQLQPSARSGTDYGSTSSFLSLRDHPADYPGRAPEFDFLYRQGRVWPVELPPGQRISKARILWTDSDNRPRRTPLTNALLRWGAAELTQRVPVLAIGSNAFPRQLFDKLNRVLIDDSIPCVRGVLSNIEIVFCPFRSSWGYIPVTPRYRHGARTKAFLQLLSAGQLREIVKTEGSYSLVALPSTVAPFTVTASGDILSQVYVFWHDAWLATFGELPAICAGTTLDDSREVQVRVVSHGSLLTSLAPSPADAGAPAEPRPATALPGTPNPLPTGAAFVDLDRPLVTYGQTGDNVREHPTGFVINRTGPIRPAAGDTDVLTIVAAADKQRLRLGRYAAAFVDITGNAGTRDSRGVLSVARPDHAVPGRVVSPPDRDGPDGAKRHRRLARRGSDAGAADDSLSVPRGSSGGIDVWRPLPRRAGRAGG